MEHMGDRIKRLREEKGLTQQELANLIGLDNRNSLSRYENGTRVPNPDIIIKLARVLDTTSDYLISAYIPDKLSNGDPVTELDIKNMMILLKSQCFLWMMKCPIWTKKPYLGIYLNYFGNLGKG